MCERCSDELNWSVIYCIYKWLVAGYASGPLGWAAPQASGTNTCQNVAQFVSAGLDYIGTCIEVVEEVHRC